MTTKSWLSAPGECTEFSSRLAKTRSCSERFQQQAHCTFDNLFTSKRWPIQTESSNSLTNWLSFENTVIFINADRLTIHRIQFQSVWTDELNSSATFLFAMVGSTQLVLFWL